MRRPPSWEDVKHFVNRDLRYTALAMLTEGITKGTITNIDMKEINEMFKAQFAQEPENRIALIEAICLAQLNKRRS